MIRNLVDSEDDQERKAQRMKLESDLEMTSERLDALVQGRVCFAMRYNDCHDCHVLLEHRDKLHGTLSTFDAVDEKIRGQGTD